MRRTGSSYLSRLAPFILVPQFGMHEFLSNCKFTHFFASTAPLSTYFLLLTEGSRPTVFFLLPKAKEGVHVNILVFVCRPLPLPLSPFFCSQPDLFEGDRWRHLQEHVRNCTLESLTCSCFRTAKESSIYCSSQCSFARRASLFTAGSSNRERHRLRSPHFFLNVQSLRNRSGDRWTKENFFSRSEALLGVWTDCNLRFWKSEFIV